MQPWQPNGSPFASLVIPLLDGVGTSFSTASVIPAGDLHFVSTAQGQVSKTHTVSQVPSTSKDVPVIRVVCWHLGGCSSKGCIS